MSPLIAIDADSRENGVRLVMGDLMARFQAEMNAGLATSSSTRSCTSPATPFAQRAGQIT